MGVNYQVKGSSNLKFSYTINKNDTYGTGKMTFEDNGTEYPVKFFQLRPADNVQYRNQVHIKMKSTQVHSRSLLCPFIVHQDDTENIIHIGYLFDQSFQEWLINGPPRPPLFRDDGLMDEWWIEQAYCIFETVSTMHDGFLYHDGLDQLDNFVSLDDSICFVLPKLLLGSKDDDLAKSDLVGLGVFFSRLPTLNGNFENVGDHSFDKEEWDDFITGFNNFGIEVVRKHPVLKSSRCRYDQLRANISQVTGSWGRTRDEWEDFKDHINKNLKKYPDWRQNIAQDEDFKAVYDERIADYNTDTPVSMLKFVENILTNLKKEVISTEIIERLVHQMFPGLCSSLHSTIASARNCGAV